MHIFGQEMNRLMNNVYGRKFLFQIRSLYAGSCPLNVVLPLWDSYFQYADHFFAFFLALVLLMFAKEHLSEMVKKEKNEIIRK